MIDDTNVLVPFFIKRRSFSHEREVRAVVNVLFQSVPRTVILSDKELPMGIALPADLNILVEDVYVAPMTPDWIMDAVQDILAKYDVKRTLRRSSLSDSPVY